MEVNAPALLVLEILREAEAPLTARDIAHRIAAHYDMSPSSVEPQVEAALGVFARQNIVEVHGER